MKLNCSLQADEKPEFLSAKLPKLPLYAPWKGPAPFLAHREQVLTASCSSRRGRRSASRHMHCALVYHEFSRFKTPALLRTGEATFCKIYSGIKT